MLRKIFPGIVLALLLTGMVMVKFNIWPTSSSQQTPLLKTDKERYELGESVTITLTNTARQVLHFAYEQPWIIYYTNPSTSEKEPVYGVGGSKLWKLEPGASKDWVWDQHYGDSRKAEPGDYVINDTQNWGLSVPFTIVTNITVPDDYRTIQAAIDAPYVGTIYVKSGIYRESIEINKPLTIVGENRENTTIDCFDLANSTIVVNILSSDVSLYNLTIKHPYSGTKHYAIAIGSLPPAPLIGNITISGNRIINCHDGIHIYRASDINITHNEFVRNWANGIQQHVILEPEERIRIRVVNNDMYLESGEGWEDSAGIRVTASKNSTFSSNNITHIGVGICTARDDGSSYINNELSQCDTGISMWDGHNNLIGDNQLYENDLCISLESSSNNSVTGNKIFENPDGTGISISYGKQGIGNNTIACNEINNTRLGIHLKSSNSNSVIDNYVFNCSQACLLERVGANIIEANVIQACRYGVSTDGSSTDNTICRNDFFDNEVCVFENGTNDWECNYYSDYEGVDTHPFDQSPSIVPRNPIPIYWKQKRYDCIINGSMTVSNFALNSDKTISFNVNGQGYVNLTIPINLLRGPFQVSANNNQIPHLISWSPEESTSICFDHSTSSVHNVRIEAQFRQAGDINGDDEVNILDISLVAIYFGEFQDE